MTIGQHRRIGARRRGDGETRGRGAPLVCALLLLLSVVCGLQSASADWTADERMVLTVDIPQKAWTLDELCGELGKQTSSEFYADRRDGDRKIAWYAGEMKLKSAMSTIETVTGMKWRTVGDMFFLCHEPEGTAVVRWNERYAEAKKVQLAGIERRRVRDWVYNSMPFPVKHDSPWGLTPLQHEQVSFHRSLLYFTMTPPQLMWLDSELANNGYEPANGMTMVDQAVAVTLEAPVSFSVGMIIRGGADDFLVEMPLSAQAIASEEQPEEPKSKPKVDSTAGDAATNTAKKLAVKEPVKGLWISDASGDLSALLKKAKAKGFNAVYLPVLRSGHSIYASKIVPREPKYKDKDGLAAAIKAAEGTGIGVHAVLDATLWGDAEHKVPPTASYLVLYERNVLGRTFIEQDRWQQAELRAMEPDEALPAASQPEEKRVFLCPASSRLPRLLASVAEEIAENYDIAGICLDGVDYPKGMPFTIGGEDMAPPYGYTLEVRREMIRLNQVDPIDVDPGSVRDTADADAFALWDKFRRGHLTGLLSEVSTVFKAKKPDAVFSATLNLGSDAQSPAHWAALTGLDALLPYAAIKTRPEGLGSVLPKEDTETIQGLHRAVVKNAAVVPAVIGLAYEFLPDQMPIVAGMGKTSAETGMKGYILTGDTRTLSAALDMLAE